MTTTADLEVETRRRQLRKWIDDHFGGKQAAFIAAHKLNQGEISSLLKDKSFGSRKARNLETKTGMPNRYLEEDDREDGEHLPVQMVDAKASAGKGSMVFSGDARKILMFRRDYLAKHDVRHEDDAMAFEVDGDSLADLHIPNGSVVIANRKKTEPISKRIYVLWLDGRLYVKQVVKVGGRWWARSHNKEKAHLYPDVPIENGDRVEGQVFSCSFDL